MRHCCNFDAYDIWYLKDDETYTGRVLFIGVCPICKKQVATLSQKNIKTNTYVTIKKIGDSAAGYIAKHKDEISYSRNNLNKMKLKPKPYGWKYGINKEKTDKEGNKTFEQYSADFNGNTELIKKIKS